MSAGIPEYFDAWASIGRTFADHPRQPVSCEALLEGMARCRIAHALVCRRDQGSCDVMTANRSLSAGLVPCLMPLWTVATGSAGDFPQGDKLLRELELTRVPAVQIFPKTHAWNPLGGEGLKLFAALAEGGWPVFVPIGQELEMADFQDLVRAVPRGRWVAVNAHWTRQHEVADMLAGAENTWITLESYHANRGVEHLIAGGFGSRILFATGAPTRSPGAARALVDWLDADASQKTAIGRDNLLRLLKFQPAGRLTIDSDIDELAYAALRGDPLPCPVIDMHSHILADGEQGDGRQVMLRGDAAGLLEMGDRLGIVRAGVMSWRGIQTPDQDEGHVPVIAASNHPSGKFWGLATIHVANKSDDQKLEELERLLASGRILGLKPYPTLGFPYDHPNYAALWKFAEERGLYIGVHPFHWYEAEEFAAICSRHPRLRVVAYHAGASYKIADTVIELCREFPNLYAEINYSSVTGGAIEYLCEGCGPERVFYGSDQPMRDPRQQLGWVVHSAVPVDAKKKIVGENAAQFIGALEAAR